MMKPVGRQGSNETVATIVPSTTAADRSLTKLRFAVGDRVVCNVGSSWSPGIVQQHWWRRPGWPQDQYAPYQVRLDTGSEIFAPLDDDKAVRAEARADSDEAPQSTTSIGHAPVVFDFSKAAQAGPGVVQRTKAPVAQHGFECPCCVDQGPDIDMMF